MNHSQKSEREVSIFAKNVTVGIPLLEIPLVWNINSEEKKII